MWGGAIKIGVRPFWGRGVFVLVISNINIGFQKSLTPPLMLLFEHKQYLQSYDSKSSMQTEISSFKFMAV